jgi:predicted ATP-grasp superfamily ATP-dependent carboligase
MKPLLSWATSPPKLRQPLLIVALEGFVDAGEAASTAAMFLRHRWRSELAGRFDRDALIDYRARRPSVVVDAGCIRRIDWPEVEVFAADVDGPHDALLLLGPEPDMRWSDFAEEVVGLCRATAVEAVIGLGAYPAAAPHTRPVRIRKAANALGAELVPEADPISGYTGPVGIGTVLQGVLAEHGIPAVGLWAEIPHYISASPNPTGALALVHLVAGAFDTRVDTTELEAAAKIHLEQVAEAVAEHPEAADMVRALEAHVDAGGPDESLPSGEDIAAEIERFLRSQ